MSNLNEIQVLIVDDNRQMRMLTRALLRAAGVHRVTEAESAINGFSLLSKVQVDIIIVDWKMEPVDGLAFTKMVRLSDNSPDRCVPILMMTAHTEQSRVAAARDAGVTGFLRKPISARALFDRMSAALLDERKFIRTDNFFGPDRRHAQVRDYAGPFRRASDRQITSTSLLETFDIDDDRIRA